MGASLLTLFTSGLILVITFGTSVLTARLLGAAGRGLLAAYTVWPQFMAYAMTLGLPSALVYNLKKYQPSGRSLLSAAIVIASATSLAAFLVGWVAIPLWLDAYQPDEIRFAQWAMVTVPIPVFMISFLSVLLARQEFAGYNYMRVLQPLTSLILLVVLILSAGLEARVAAVAILVAGLPGLIWLFARMLRIYPPTSTGTVQAGKRLLSYGFRSYGYDLTVTLAGQLDRVMVAGLLSPAFLGMYVVAANLTQVSNVLFSSVASVLFPKAADRTVAEVRELTGRAVSVSIVCSSVVSLVAIVAAPWVLETIYGDEFIGAVLVLRILFIDALLKGTSSVLIQTFMALDRPGVNTLIQGMYVAFAGSLVLTLTPRFGIEGAAIAMLVASIARLTVTLVCYPLVLGVRIPRMMMNRADLIQVLRLGR